MMREKEGSTAGNTRTEQMEETCHQTIYYDDKSNEMQEQWRDLQAREMSNNHSEVNTDTQSPKVLISSQSELQKNTQLLWHPYLILRLWSIVLVFCCSIIILWEQNMSLNILTNTQSKLRLNKLKYCSQLMCGDYKQLSQAKISVQSPFEMFQ